MASAEQTVALLATAQAAPVQQPQQRLGARLEQTLKSPPTRRRFAAPAAAAVAAALLLAIPTWVAVDRNSSLQAMRQDERALARLAAAGTQIDHADFMGPGKHPMDAKVLYGPHGDWYYILVMHPKPDMQVAYVHDGRMQMLGRVAMHGESGTLYLPVNHKMDELALMQGQTVVADAHLVY